MSNSEVMGMRRPPFVFTEHGVLMLSSVLNSKRAIQVKYCWNFVLDALDTTDEKLNELTASYQYYPFGMKMEGR